jgi:hypothetical protein
MVKNYKRIKMIRVGQIVIQHPCLWTSAATAGWSNPSVIKPDIPIKIMAMDSCGGSTVGYHIWDKKTGKFLGNEGGAANCFWTSFAEMPQKSVIIDEADWFKKRTTETKNYQYDKNLL